MSSLSKTHRSDAARHDNTKVALVTGSGAKRVGNFVVRALAARGYAVVVHAHLSVDEARATVAELEADGAQAMVVVGDLSEEVVVERIVGEVVARFGRIDVLVNCAAIWKSKPLEEVRAADVREHFEANTLSTFLCCRSVGLQMVAQPEGGVIVNVGDWATERPYRDYAAYFPSKGAIPTTTRMFAVELAARNPKVRVNAVLPGPVMLPPELTEDERRQAIAGTLVKHEGSPQHVAAAVLALVENEFITGVCLPVDGGRTIA
ncbi:MAG: SDR family oxidoreductase [Planctomycetia bacterium]|nr:SDR family oxidoreductase [Planctomycetia bacterium]